MSKAKVIQFVKDNVKVLVFVASFVPISYALYALNEKNNKLEAQVVQLLKQQIDINDKVARNIRSLSEANNINAEYLYELARIFYREFPNSDISERLTRAIDRGSNK